MVLFSIIGLALIILALLFLAFGQIDFYTDDAETSQEKNSKVNSSSLKLAGIKMNRKFIALFAMCGVILAAVPLYNDELVNNLAVNSSSSSHVTKVQRPKDPEVAKLLDYVKSFHGKSSHPKKQAASQNPAGNINTMIEKLVDKLKKEPKNSKGWMLLGWSYYHAGQYKDSIASFEKGLALKSDVGAWHSAYGGALVKAADDKVTPKALKAFEKALSISNNDKRARYFIALSKKQKGNKKGALDDWLVLIKDVPENIQFYRELRQKITVLAAELGENIEGKLPKKSTVAKTSSPIQKVKNTVQDSKVSEVKAVKVKPELKKKKVQQQVAQNSSLGVAKGLSPDELKQASQLSDSDRQQMIKGMVDGLDEKLKESPKDANKWMMLIRSRVVLNEMDKAKTALKSAIEIFKDEPETQKKIVTMANGLGVKEN